MLLDAFATPKEPPTAPSQQRSCPSRRRTPCS